MITTTKEQKALLEEMREEAAAANCAAAPMVLISTDKLTRLVFLCEDLVYGGPPHPVEILPLTG